MRCHEDKGLVINLNGDGDKIVFSRCCYLQPFYTCKRDYFEKIKDIIKFSQEVYDNLEEKNLNYLNETNDRCPTCDLKKDIKSVSVGLSKACNLNCYNCFRSSHKESLNNKKLYFNTLKKLKGQKLDSISLTDQGEPFFYFKDTIKYLKSLSSVKDTKKVIFTTNTTFLNRDVIKLLKKLSDKTGVEYIFICSIDGVTKETYEKTRPGAPFEKVISNYCLLLKTFGFNSARVAFTLKRTNYEDAEKVVPYFTSLGAKIITYYYDIFDINMKKLFFEKINNFEFLLY